MKSRFAVVLVGLLTLLMVPGAAHAHVLIRDDTKNVGAVLHIDPDDDPIAGQQSVLFFDIEGDTIKSGEVLLKITNAATNQTLDAPVTFTKSSVTSLYTFPSQGAYEMRLTITSPSSKTYTFDYSQRVARGTSSSQLQPTVYPLATLGIIGSSIGLILISIICVNRRREISIYSQF